MMKLTEMNKAIIYAYNLGYRVSKIGLLIKPNNKKVLPFKDDQGYRKFSIRFNGKRKNIRLHRLQAYQMFGAFIFNENIQVRHLNNNKHDNSADNISIGSQSDNFRDLDKKERIKKTRNARISCIKSNRRNDWDCIISDKMNGMSFNQLKKKYNVWPQNVYNEMNRRNLKQPNQI